MTKLISVCVLVIMFASLGCKHDNKIYENENSVVPNQQDNSDETLNQLDTILNVEEDKDSLSSEKPVQKPPHMYSEEELDSVRRCIDSKYASMPKILKDNILNYWVSENPYGIMVVIKNCTPDLLKLFKDSVTDFPYVYVFELL